MTELPSRMAYERSFRAWLVLLLGLTIGVVGLALRSTNLWLGWGLVTIAVIGAAAATGWVKRDPSLRNSSVNE